MAIELASLEVPIRVTGDTTAAGALRRVEVAGTRAANRITGAMAPATASITKATAAATAATPAFAGFAAAATRVAGAFGAILGVQAVAGLLRSSVTEAQNAEKVWARLQSAVEAAGVSYSTVAPEIERATKRIQASTRFDDEAAAEGLATLVSVTRDYAKSLDALPVAVDLAVRAQIDLDTAAKLVGRAIIGQTETLTRYGIVIDKNKDALAQIREQSRGYAERDGKTLTGQLAIQRARWSDLKEEIGRGILPALVAVRGAALRLAEMFAAPSPLMVGIGVAILAIGALTTAVWAFNAALAATAAGGLAAFLAGIAAMALNPVGLAIVGLGAAIGGVTALVLQAKREAADYAARLRELAAAGSHAREKLMELARMGRHDPPKPGPTEADLEAARKAQAAFDAETDALLTLAGAGQLAESEFGKFTRRQAEVNTLLARGNLLHERKIALLRQQAAFEELTRRAPEPPVKFTPEEERTIARPPAALPGAANAGAPNVVETDAAGLQQLADGLTEMNDGLEAQRQRTADILATLQMTIAAGIAGAVAAAATGGNIGEAIAQAVGAGLQQLGMAAIEYGVAAIGLAKLVAKIQAALFTNPTVAIVAGAALVAIGAALAKAGQRSTKIAQGGGGGGGAQLADVTTDITVNPRAPGTSSAVATAAAIRPVAPVNVQATFLGSTHDPTIGPWLVATVANAQRRGHG